MDERAPTYNWRVIGRIAEQWDCDCPDCPTGGHTEPGKDVDKVVASAYSQDAIDLVGEDIAEENHWDEWTWIGVKVFAAPTGGKYNHGLK